MEKIIIDLEVKSKKGVKEVEKLNKGVKQTNKEVSKTKKEIKETNDSVGTLGAGALGAFNKFKTGVLGVVKGFKSLKFAIIATGIGALLVGILAVKTAFTNSEKGQNKFAKLMGVIGSITGNLIDLLASLGEKIIYVFENPKQAIKDFAKLIKENITNRFEGILELIPSLGKAVSELFKGNFSEAGKIAADAVGKVALGVESITTSISNAKDALSDFTKELADDSKIAADIADKRAKADKLDRDLITERAKANRDIAELRLKSELKDKFAVAERIKFLKEANAIEEETTNKAILSAKLRRDAIIAENKLSGSTKADLDAEAQARAKIIELETAKLRLNKRLATRIIEYQNEEKAGIKKISDAKKKALDKEEAAAIKKAALDAKTELTRLKSINKIQKEYKEKRENQEAETEIQKIELEQTRALAELDRLNATEEQKSNIKLYYAGLIEKEEDKNRDTKQKLDKIREKQTLGDAKNSFNQMAQLAGKDSKIGKAMAIASATISGVQGAQNAYTTAQKSPITLAFPAYPVVQAGLAGAIALKNIAAIKSVNSSGGGGSIPKPSAPSIPSAPPAFNIVGQSNTNQLADAIGGQSRQPTRAYVVSSDVTTSQEMDRNIITESGT
jgi:hypothetical protein